MIIYRVSALRAREAHGVTREVLPLKMSAAGKRLKENKGIRSLAKQVKVSLAATPFPLAALDD